MGTILQTGEFLVLHGISWREYRLLSKLLDEHNVRLTYLDGRLEIVSPSAEHETVKERLAVAVRLLSDVLELDYTGYGSTTFKRRRRDAGKEPDTCFYFGENADRMYGKTKVDLRVDPPPDLAIEVVVASRETVTLATYRRLRVPEVWWYEGGSLTIRRLDASGRYAVVDGSVAIRGLPAAMIEAWLDTPARNERIWRKLVGGPIAETAAALRAKWGGA